MSQPWVETLYESKSVRLGPFRYRNTCVVCGTTFLATTSRARTCSDTCRNASRHPTPEFGKLLSPLTVDMARRRNLHLILQTALDHLEDYADGKFSLSSVGLNPVQNRSIKRIRNKIQSRKTVFSLRRNIRFSSLTGRRKF